MVYLAENLREIRHFEGQTQEEFAKKLNISRVNLGQYEFRDVQPPYQTIFSFCKILDFTFEELVFEKIDTNFIGQRKEELAYKEAVSAEQRAKTRAWLNKGNRI